MMYKNSDMLRNMFEVNTRPVALGALVLVVIGTFSALTEFALLRAEKAKFLASRLDYLAVVADLKADTIRDFHHERLHDLQIYASNMQLHPSFEDAVRGDAVKIRQLAKIFKPLFAFGDYESVAVVDRRGRYVLVVPADSDPPRPSAGRAGAPRFLGIRRSASGISVLEYEAAIAGGARLITRVRSSALLSPVTQRWPGIEKTAETLIFQREENSLIAISNFRHRANSGPALRVPLDADIIAARAARGEAGPMLGLDYRRVPCYAAVRVLPELGWIIVAKADENELLAPLRQKNELIVIASIVVFLLVAILLVLFHRTQGERLRGEANSERLLLSTAIEQAGESIVITDKNGRILYTNPAFTRATGYTREEAYAKSAALIKSGRQDSAFYKNLWETVARGEVWKGRLINKRKDGVLFEEDATITPVRDAGGDIGHYIAVKRDVSAVRTLEDQLLHSQKIGIGAAGITPGRPLPHHRTCGSASGG